MGSIVKTIGKVIKKVGKALKKIAPVLLVAAAAYVGYGYMTGFQAGGWPQITEWGKSLMGGVGQGMPISEAANAAGGITDGMGLPDMGAAVSGETEALMSGLDAPADVTTRALTPDTTTPSTDIMGADTGGAATGGMIDGMGLPTEGGLLSQIQDTTNTRFTALMDEPLYPSLSNQVSSYLEAPAKQGGGFGDFFLGTAQANPMQTGVPFSGMGDAPNLFTTGHPGMVINQNPAVPFTVGGGANVTPAATVAQTTTPSTVPSGSSAPWDSFTRYPPHASGALPHGQDPSFLGMMAGLGKKAWNFYKGMWSSNPWMTMWTTQKVIESIAALMNDQEEKEAWRSRHVAGFEPGGPDEVRKRYGGNLPGGNINRAGVGEKRRQSSLKAGPQISGGVRTSAIDRKPQGLLGSKQPRQIERVVG